MAELIVNDALSDDSELHVVTSESDSRQCSLDTCRPHPVADDDQATPVSGQPLDSDLLAQALLAVGADELDSPNCPVGDGYFDNDPTLLSRTTVDESTTKSASVCELDHEAAAKEFNAEMKARLLAVNPDLADDINFLVGTGVSELVIKEALNLIKNGALRCSDLDHRSLEQMVNMPDEQVLYVLKQFSQMNLIGVKNRVGFLSTLFKHFRERVKSNGAVIAMDRTLMSTPNVDEVQKLLERTGYDLEVTIGQRKFSMPGMGETVAKPGTEVYVGKIPKDTFEVDLVPLFESFGKMRDMRIMMDPNTGFGKGYAFVTYVDPAAASAAAKKLEGFEVRPGKPLRVNVSVASTRLFVGNIPKSKGKDEILEEFFNIAGACGVVDVVVYPNPNDPIKRKNRGFCFLDFVDHKSASHMKRRLTSSRTRPWNMDIVVEWAESHDNQLNDEQKRTLYIRPLKESVTEDMLRALFCAYGEVTRVKRIKDYGFVHYRTHEEAALAMEAKKGQSLDGIPCEITYAKPPSDRSKRKADESFGHGANSMPTLIGPPGRYQDNCFGGSFEMPQAFGAGGGHSQAACSPFIVRPQPLGASMPAFQSTSAGSYVGSSYGDNGFGRMQGLYGSSGGVGFRGANPYVGSGPMLAQPGGFAMGSAAPMPAYPQVGYNFREPESSAMFPPPSACAPSVGAFVGNSVGATAMGQTLPMGFQQGIAMGNTSHAFSPGHAYKRQQMPSAVSQNHFGGHSGLGSLQRVSLNADWTAQRP